MIAALIVMGLLILVLIVLLVVAAMRIEGLYVRLENSESAKHDLCTGLVLSAVGDKHEANVLRIAALACDSPKGRYELEVLGRRWTPGGSSLPRMWLEDRAARVEAGFDG